MFAATSTVAPCRDAALTSTFTPPVLPASGRYSARIPDT